MNYQDTVNWMFQQLPMYQNQGKSAYKKDLTNTILLAKHLNNPENDLNLFMLLEPMVKVQRAIC